MRDLLEGLNEAQRQAVLHKDGPLLVIAGPGSGKTRVITHRVAYLLHHFGIPARRILALTFTNKAADELKQRITTLVGDQRPTACTFHSLCARLLREFASKVGRTNRFTIADQRDRNRLLASVIRDAGHEVAHFTPDAIERRIGQLKSDLISPQEFAANAAGVFDQTVGDVYRIYNERLADADTVDFDDLLYLTADLLRRDPEVRSQLDRRFEYVLVDEYQDTNLAQYAIARALSMDSPNLCVTGDPDQSIYSWRGANIRNILDFEQDFPAAKVVRLERNYRSHQHILAVADGLIRHNISRKIKDLWSENPPGHPVVVRCFRDDRDEAAGIASEIRQTVDDGERRYRDIAVFVRTTSLTRPIEAAFRERRIPYRIVGGFSFFERKEIRDAVAYLRLAWNPKDDAAFTRVVNVPARGIGETSIQKLSLFARANRISLAEAARQAPAIPTIRGKAKKAVSEFGQMVFEIGNSVELPLGQAVQEVIQRSGCLLQFDRNDIEDRDRIENIESLSTSAFELEKHEPEADLGRFLEVVSLSTDMDEFDSASDLVSIMTLHAAKGLEFPMVYMVAFEQKVLPHERSLQEQHIEEERRLAFVGITRAKERLQLSYCVRRARFGSFLASTPSCFLAELPEDSLKREDRVEFPAALNANSSRFDDVNQEVDYEEPAIQVLTRASSGSRSDRFAKGMFVDHPEYGRGRILQLEGIAEGRKATVFFPTVGNKRFVLSKSPLEPA